MPPRIEAMLLVAPQPLPGGGMPAPAARMVERPAPATPGLSIVRAVGYSSAEARPESYWAAGGPFWPAAFLRRPLQPLGHQVVVARFPAHLQFEVLCLIESIEDCELCIEVRDPADRVVFTGPPHRVHLHPLGHAETAQAERFAMQNPRVSFVAESPGLYAVAALLDGVQAATARLLVRTPAS